MYAVTDLGTFGGDFTTATALNNRGQVVGYSRTAGGHMRAFLWEAGAMHDLGTYRRRHSSCAWDINDAGVVVGHTLTAADRSRGIRWSGGRVRDLGALGGGESSARAINNRGQVAGYGTVPGEGDSPWDTRAILHEGGAMRNLGPPGSVFSRAFGINDAGIVAGALITRVGAGGIRAFVLDTRAGDAVRVLDPLPGHDECYALDINDAGHVVGWSESTPRVGVRQGSTRAFLHADGVLRELGVPPGYHHAAAAALNNHGQVVGSGALGPGDGPLASYALLWQGETALALNDLGLLGRDWVLIGAADINDVGQLIVDGYRAEQRRAFLLTPHASTARSPVAVD